MHFKAPNPSVLLYQRCRYAFKEYVNYLRLKNKLLSGLARKYSGSILCMNEATTIFLDLLVPRKGHLLRKREP